MQGLLFKYGHKSTHVAFMSNPQHKQHIVLVGGLTDGLLPTPYCAALTSAAKQLGWSVVQAQLSSSYQGYGVASLDQDADELHLLSQYLYSNFASQGMLLMGHSTGCQDAVRYAQRHGTTVQDCAPLLGVILQAPVSDVEYLSRFPALADLVQPAQHMVAEGKGEDILFRATDLDGAPMTARRFLSLYCNGGDDDMFSQHFTDEDLRVGFIGGVWKASAVTCSAAATPQMSYKQPSKTSPPCCSGCIVNHISTR
eukprot:jgi/Chrzof1/3304/Cz12g20080.t1